MFAVFQSDKDKSFDVVKLGVSFPFDPSILKPRWMDSSLLKVSRTPIHFVLPPINLFEVIHPLPSDLDHRRFEVSGWFNKQFYVVIIIYADLPPGKYVFCN